MGVVIGVDSHKSSLAVGVIDELGRVLAAREFSNEERGHGSLLAWIDQHGADRTIGIEGSGSYGAVLARRLIDRNERVFEVPAFISHRERKKRPARGKSDVDDAIAIARVAARGEGLSSPTRHQVLEDLKLLSDHRDQLVRTRTQMINRTHRDLVVTCPGYERRIPKLTSKRKLAEARSLLRGDRSIRAELVRDRIGEITRLNEKIAAAEKRIALRVKESNTTLTQLRGVGFIVAAKILGEVGDPSRIRSKGSFAMLTGTAPIQASSGQTQRHRLNRGGNRQLNYALYVMALARCRGDADTKTYVARLREEGKSEKEILRCLKRQLSNLVFRHLQSDLLSGLRTAA